MTRKLSRICESKGALWHDARAAADAGQKEIMTMRASAFAVLLLGSAFLFGIGCKKDEAPAASGDSDSTGVAECDEYFKQLNTCFAANPAAKAAMEGTQKQMKEAFKAQVAAPGGKDALKKQCEEHIKLLGQNPMCAKK
ncbi:MAG: hypothetical protein IPK82_32185 [Polyangiaceae bacterium]|nr:hypothetical protein [Polyangiaceae bacterium]